jgi:hypothetical protein
VSVNEACRILGIFQADTIPAWRRDAAHSAESRPGRYRVGDLLKFLRASAEKHVARTNAGKHSAASRFRAPPPRHDVSAEEPGIVEPVKVEGDARHDLRLGCQRS